MRLLSVAAESGGLLAALLPWPIGLRFSFPCPRHDVAGRKKCSGKHADEAGSLFRPCLPLLERASPGGILLRPAVPNPGLGLGLSPKCVCRTAQWQYETLKIGVFMSPRLQPRYLRPSNLSHNLAGLCPTAAMLSEKFPRLAGRWWDWSALSPVGSSEVRGARGKLGQAANRLHRGRRGRTIWHRRLLVWHPARSAAWNRRSGCVHCSPGRR